MFETLEDATREDEFTWSFTVPCGEWNTEDTLSIHAEGIIVGAHKIPWNDFDAARAKLAEQTQVNK